MSGTTIRLADLCGLVRDSVKPGTQPDALYLGLEHLASGRLTPIGNGQASNMRSVTSAFQSGDVLYGKLRPYLNKAVLADKAGVCTTELLVLRAKAGVDPRFLVAVVHSPSFLDYAVAGTTGVQHPRTSWSHARDFEIPSFSPDEQQRIANFAWLVHEAVDRAESLIQGSQALKRAAIRTLFTRGLHGETQKETETGTVPKSWGVVPLSSLCVSADSVDFRSEANRTIQYVDVSSISRDYLKIETTSRYVLREAPGRARKRVLTGDVIFATVRPTLLRAAIVPEELDNQVCSTAFCVLRRDPEKAVNGFAYYLVQRQQFVQRLAESETGASYPAVTDRMVKETLVPRPTLNEQREIVAILNAIDRKIDLQRRKRAVLEELFKALLHNLLTGEIRAADIELSALSSARRFPSSEDHAYMRPLERKC